ncbi:MAG: CdaR family protein [Eubacteriales bacterium]|nr:CdaR family protein [Eubacteriales bacterium]
MKKALTNNLALKLMSVAVAVCIWMFVVNVDDPIATKKFTGVSVQILNTAYVEQNGQMYLQKQGQDTTTVVVTGRRKQLQKLTASDVVATADLRQAISLSTDPVMLPISVTCKGIEQDQIVATPRNISVTLEQAQSQEFLINVNSRDIKTGKGYEIGTVSASPEKIRITGPASLMNKIDKVVAYMNTSISGITTDVTDQVDLKIIDKNQEEFTENQMKYLKYDTSKVNVSVKLWRVKTDVKIQGQYSGAPEAGYQVGTVTITPSAVSVTGDSDALALLEENGNVIEIPAEMIDVTGHRNDFETKVDLSELLPDNLRLTADTQETVLVQVSILPEGSSVYTIRTKDITVENAPRDLVTVFETDAVELRVKAQEGIVLEDLDPSDIKVSVDLEDMVEGSYKVPLDVELPEGYALVSRVTTEVMLSQMKDVEESTQN